MSGAPRKQEKDYSEEVKTLQSQAEELAKVSYHRRYIEADSQSGNLQGAIDKITGLEKQTRNVSFSSLILRPS
jgi:26S proteasome regulatory subunit N5